MGTKASRRVSTCLHGIQDVITCHAEWYADSLLPLTDVSPRIPSEASVGRHMAVCHVIRVSSGTLLGECFAWQVAVANYHRDIQYWNPLYER